ncbi:hypothetical protein [Corallococcus sp. RDP092CA]|uniref:hypothetical protein n=1 Tax=Corallococcus sp. RDP092CA TaxID=3109369 RepID=UPI0035AF1998
MTSIRRVGSGISTSRAWSISNDLEVTAPVKQEPMTPVEPVRRGFSDASDFKADADGDLAGALLADVGLTSDASSPEDSESRAALLENPHLRTFAGESTFEASAPAYAQRLGTPQASTPMLQARHFQQAERRAEAPPADPSLDPSDILSPDEAAWELQNLDTQPSTVSTKEAEDLLFLLESGDLSGLSDEELAALSDELGMEDADLEASGDADGLEASGAPEDSSDFLATMEDSGPELPRDEAPSTPPSSDFLADADDFTMEAVQAEAAYSAAYAEALTTGTALPPARREVPVSEPEPSVVVAPNADAQGVEAQDVERQDVATSNVAAQDVAASHVEARGAVAPDVAAQDVERQDVATSNVAAQDASPAVAAADVIEDVQDADLVEIDAARTPPPPPGES